MLYNYQSMKDQSRRSFIKTGIGVTSIIATGGLSGCTESVPSFSGSSVPDTIPEDADSVLFADVEAILGDEGVQALTDAYLEQQSQYEYYDGPESFEEALEEFEDESDIELGKVKQATVFSEFGSEEYSMFNEEYGGLILQIDITIEDIVDSLEDNGSTEFDEGEYNGNVVFEAENDELMVGVLPADESIAIGTEDAVEDVIDVASGDEESMDDDLADAFNATRESPFRFASRLPDTDETREIPEEVEGFDEDGNREMTDISVIDDVETVGGSVYRDGTVRGLEVSLNTDSESTAEEIVELVEDLQSDWVERLEQSDSEEAGDAANVLDEITVEQDGATVLSSLEKEISEMEALIEEYVGPRDR